MLLDQNAAVRFAQLALDCVHREYPNKIAHVMQSDDDVAPPRRLTPAFYGCFDWHSAVHGHWLLVRLVRLFPDARSAADARQALDQSLTQTNIAAELDYLGGADRAGFERPYGLAWLLQLAAELHEWSDDQAQVWRKALQPLERLAAARLAEWLPKLTHPIRSGEHSQTAFAMGLAFDWARTVEDRTLADIVSRKALDFHAADVDGPLHLEPSGHDFLSPCLAESDLLRRILAADEFGPWLSRFLPHIPQDGSTEWLRPAYVSDPADGKLTHLNGLHLSRAWMLDGIAAGLPEGDPRRGSLREAARQHAETGLRAATGQHYALGHWIGTFAVYYATRRGVSSS